MKPKTILVTGAAGFIGSHLVLRLLKTDPECSIVGIDNLNPYYDVSLKEYRLSQIARQASGAADGRWQFIRGSIADGALIRQLFRRDPPGYRRQPRRTGRGALFDHQPGRLYRKQPDRLLQHPRSLPPFL